MNINEFLEKYRFNPETDLINEGGFGKIYHAWGEHDQEVAIKVCHVQNNKYTLKREFDLASKLSKHPNIAYYEKVYEFDIPGVGRMEYAIMQYYPAGDLRKVLESHALTEEDKYDILMGIIDGVSFLHNSGIIHRDLKPGNILMQKVQGKWRPKITDFGLGKSFSGNGEISNTSAGIVSLLYASPEQILGHPTLPNTDLWPIGIITYLLFTGKLPFESDLPKETESYRADVSKKIVAGIVPDGIESLPEPFKTICKKSLVVHNADRVQSAIALASIINSTGNVSVIGDNNVKSSSLEFVNNSFDCKTSIVNSADEETGSLSSKSEQNNPNIHNTQSDISPNEKHGVWIKHNSQLKKKKGLAITSFVLAVLGSANWESPGAHHFAIRLFTLAILTLSVFAIIFGAIALRNIRFEPLKYRGKGFAIAGIIIGSIDFLFLLLLR